MVQEQTVQEQMVQEQMVKEEAEEARCCAEPRFRWLGRRAALLVLVLQWDCCRR